MAANINIHNPIEFGWIENIEHHSMTCFTVFKNNDDEGSNGITIKEITGSMLMKIRELKWKPPNWWFGWPKNSIHIAQSYRKTRKFRMTNKTVKWIAAKKFITSIYRRALVFVFVLVIFAFLNCFCRLVKPNSFVLDYFCGHRTRKKTVFREYVHCGLSSFISNANDA